MNRRKSGSVRAWGLCALAILMALCAPAWAYKQDYLYEDRGSWRNVQVATGEHGSTYFIRRGGGELVHLQGPRGVLRAQGGPGGRRPSHEDSGTGGF